MFSSIPKELATPSEDYKLPYHFLAGSEGTGPGPVWHAEVYLPGTILLPPLAVKIIQGKVIGRSNLIVPSEVVFEPVLELILGILAPSVLVGWSH